MSTMKKNASGVRILSRITDCPDYPMQFLLLNMNLFQKYVPIKRISRLSVARLSGFHCMYAHIVAVIAEVFSRFGIYVRRQIPV